MSLVGTEFETWVCPRCRGAYAAPGIEGRDLSHEWNRDTKFKPTFTRDVCQPCTQTIGDTVRRIKCIAIVQREWTPPIPNLTQEEYFQYMETQRMEGEKKRESPSH